MSSFYLIPSSLGSDDVHLFLPKGTLEIIQRLKYFIVENEKTARHFLKTCNIPTPQSELIISVLDKHNTPDFNALLVPALKGNDMGLLSEAGCPGVADPGAGVVKAAYANNIVVMPLVGPSSLLLALMASGMNGQSFCFHGYLPMDADERMRKIKRMEKDSISHKQTQLFIETPYRNNNLLKDLITHCDANTRLCIACNLTLPDEFVFTKKIAVWKKELPDLNKKPVVFLMG